MLHRVRQVEDESEVVVRVARVFEILAARIRDPDCVSLAQLTMFLFFVANPFRLPVLLIKQSGLPPTHVATWIMPSILIPGLYAPVVALFRLKWRAGVRNADGFVRLHLAAVPHVSRPGEQRRLCRHLDLIRGLLRAEPPVLQYPGKNRVL